jgi:hypothetical protein
MVIVNNFGSIVQFFHSCFSFATRFHQEDQMFVFLPNSNLVMSNLDVCYMIVSPTHGC